MKILPYTLDRVRICSHHLILHAKVASNSLRTCGTPVDVNTWTLPTLALIRNPLQRWISGYIMYLADLSRHSTGLISFQPPHHFVYDVHTSQQIYKIRKDTHLIRFEEIDHYATRCGFTLPHIHPTPEPLKPCKVQLVQWLKDNPKFKRALKEHLRFDYQLRDKCVSVQSLPDNFFIK